MSHVGGGDTGKQASSAAKVLFSVAAMAEFLVSSAQLRGAQQWAGAPGVLQDPSPDMTGVSPVHAAPGWIPSNLGYLLFLEILEATN